MIALFVWWTFTSIAIGLILRLPYDAFVEHKFFTTVFGIILGPVVWLVLMLYWIVYIKDMVTNSFKRQQ